MPRTYITDLTHYEGIDDPELGIPAAARRIGRFFRAIAEQAAAGSAGGIVQTSVACRARPGRKPCPGRILAQADDDPTALHWWCPVCGENGMISHWMPADGFAGPRVATPALDPQPPAGPGSRTDRDRAGEAASGDLDMARVILRRLDAIMDRELVVDDAEYGLIVRAIADGAEIHLRECGIPLEVARSTAAELLREAERLYVRHWLQDAAEAGADAEEGWDEEAEKRLARQAFHRATRRIRGDRWDTS